MLPRQGARAAPSKAADSKPDAYSKHGAQQETCCPRRFGLLTDRCGVLWKRCRFRIGWEQGGQSV
jgi:hypothetical protein